jgi:anti-sigma regulatory factor (Ser/Thr protein kinase)
MSRQTRKLTFYPDGEHFSRCYAATAEMAERLKMSPEDKFRFAICVSEAYTNAHIHGNRSNPAKGVNLIFTWDADFVRVDVEDQGEGNTSSLRIEASRPDVDAEECGGRGVGIMKEFADRLEVEERQEGGLRVSIIFRLRKQNPQAGVLQNEPNGGVHGNQSNRT